MTSPRITGDDMTSEVLMGQVALNGLCGGGTEAVVYPLDAISCSPLLREADWMYR